MTSPDPHTADLVSAAPVTSRRPITLVVAGSLALGLVLAIALVVGPASGGTEALVTGSVLLAFGIGWLLLAVLSIRYTDRPQRWAFAPAVAMGAVGLALIAFAPRAPVLGLLSWPWPPALLVLAIWMLIQIRRHVPGRATWLLYPVAAALVLAAVGGAFETLSQARDDATYPMTGQLVDIGGRKLRIECSGNGDPTVVFESGLGQASPYWGRIAQSVSATTRVCVYDRAGQGRSEDAGGPQDGDAVASDLHMLLANAGTTGPFVLVGHSTGGPYIRVFAARYPDEVAGMVLLDPQPADAFTSLPQYPATYRTGRLLTSILPSLGRVGLWRVVTALTPAGLPSPYEERERAERSTPALLSSQRDEFAMVPATLAQASALTTIGDKPLVVVTATVDQQPGWVEAQDALVRLSTNSSHRLATGQSHASLILSEGGASVSARAIRDVIESVRTGAPVADAP
jgi:pimeloyl-ACP methyl ester carboxylesterase